MVPSYMMPEQLRLARVQLCVGLFLFSPAAVQPHEAAERGRCRPRKGTAVVVQGTGKSGQCRQVGVEYAFFCLMQMHIWLPKVLKVFMMGRLLF